jgi:hypothetical protein
VRGVALRTIRQSEGIVTLLSGMVGKSAVIIGKSQDFKTANCMMMWILKYWRVSLRSSEVDSMKELCSWIWGNQFARGCVVTVLVILIGAFLWEFGYEAALYDCGIKTETVTDSK